MWSIERMATQLFFFLIMKQLFIFTLLVVLISSCSHKPTKPSEHQSKADRPKAIIEWRTETNHDFGVYHERIAKSFSFVFYNIGDVPFVIDSVTTTCGCTHAEYSKKPILPGHTDSICVTYSGNGFTPGFFNQTCRVYSNSIVPIELKIKGIFDHVE